MRFKAILSIMLSIPIIAEDRQFIFVITSYNNATWCQLNLKTLAEQDYTNWIAYYMDDCSTDSTEQKVKEYIRNNKLEHKITYFRNGTRRYKIFNLYNVISICPDDAIIIIYDGDDWLAHPQVLSRIIKEYENPNTWVTYGSYLDEPGIRRVLPLDPEVIEKNLIRKDPFIFKAVPGHPFTFYAWLFKRIKLTDFIIDRVAFPKAGSDMIFIPPILEMAGKRISYIPDILCIHNCYTALADVKVAKEEQRKTSLACLNKNAYQPIETLTTQ